jgi:hypothetical protein
MAGNILTYQDVRRSGAFRPARLLREFLAALHDGLIAYRRYQTLSSYGDRALARAGLTRADLVREAVFPSDRSFR